MTAKIGFSAALWMILFILCSLVFFAATMYSVCLDGALASFNPDMKDVVGRNQKSRAEDERYIDSYWFSLQTITTTGYGSFDPWIWTRSLKRWSIAFMISGSAVWTVLIGLITAQAFELLKPVKD